MSDSARETEIVGVLNRAVAQVYAGAPHCEPQNPFKRESTLSDADPSAPLLSTFAIFRRPATPEELSLLSPERGLPARGIYRRFARIATSSSGRQFLVFPAQNVHLYKPRPARCIAAFRRDFARLVRARSSAFRRAAGRALDQVVRDEWAGAAPAPAEGFFMFEHNHGGGGSGGGGSDLAAVSTHGLFTASSRFARGRPTTTVVSGLVPDGVAKVRFRFGVRRRSIPVPAVTPNAGPRSTTGKPYPRPFIRLVTVRDNVVSLRVPRAAIDALDSGRMEWIAADGSTLRHVGL